MPVTIDIEKDYLYNLGLKKAEALVKQAREAVTKVRARAEKEKAMLQAKVKAEAEKAEKEKAALQAKAKAEKKTSIQKMKAKKFSDEEIMEFLNLDKKRFQQLLKEIESERK